MAENKLVTGVISPYLKLGYNSTYNWFRAHLEVTIKNDGLLKIMSKFLRDQ